MPTKVKDAVIIAAGKGSRMLPASIYCPKEFLPLIDVPSIHHIFSEAVRAGVERIHVVISEEKRAFVEELVNLSDKFLPDGLEAELPTEILYPIPGNVSLEIHIQKDQLGVGDALSCALEEISGPCLVMLGDNLLMPEKLVGFSKGLRANPSEASSELVKEYNKEGLAIAGLTSVFEEDVSSYGVVEMSGNMVVEIVEKPKMTGASKNLVLCGRYVFPPDLGEILNRSQIVKMGELQSIGMLMEYAKGGRLIGHRLDGYKWYDFGTPTSWLNAMIDHARSRGDFAFDF